MIPTILHSRKDESIETVKRFMFARSFVVAGEGRERKEREKGGAQGNETILNNTKMVDL